MHGHRRRAFGHGKGTDKGGNAAGLLKRQDSTAKGVLKGHGSGGRKVN
jgi:hypothetical protein